MRSLIQNVIAWIDKEFLPTYGVKLDLADTKGPLGSYWMQKKGELFLSHSYLKAYRFCEYLRLRSGIHSKVYVSRYHFKKESIQ